MTSAKELVRILKQLSQAANKSLVDEGVAKREITTEYQVDVRYRGQGLRLTIAIDLAALETSGLAAIAAPFDAEHKRLFTFALELEHEIVTLRASVQGRGIRVRRSTIARGAKSARAAVVGSQVTHMDGKRCLAPVYNRTLLKSGNVITGPAIVMEMDSTTVILPKHLGRVDTLGNILIYPVGFVPRRKTTASTMRNRKPSSRRK
jgi:N-methylhydantoinase A